MIQGRDDFGAGSKKKKRMKERMKEEKVEYQGLGMVCWIPA